MSNNNIMLNNLMSSVMNELKEANMIGNYSEQIVGFFKAIDWHEKWILSIIGFHVICFLISIGLRNQHNKLSIYFFVLLGFASLTQPLNNLGMKHWKLFSNQPYFDSTGLFVVIVYAFPIIFNSMIALIFILKATMSLMIDTKRLQLKKQKIKKN